MLPIPKPLRVFLPLATATTATIFTVYLVASFSKELNKQKEEDQALENIELESKEFEEEIIQGPEESEKDEKNDSSPSENKKEDLDPKKDKEKQEVTSEEELKQVLSEADNLVKQLAEQGGSQENKVKNIELQGSAKISQTEDERVTKQEKNLTQSLNSSKIEGPEPSITQEREKAGSDTEERKQQKDQEPTSAKDLELEPPSPSDQDSSQKSLQDGLIEEESEGGLQETGVPETDEAEENSGVVASDSQGSEAHTSELEESRQGEALTESGREVVNDSDSEDGGSEITPETVAKLLALSGEMSGYKFKLQDLLRSIK